MPWSLAKAFLDQNLRQKSRKDISAQNCLQWRQGPGAIGPANWSDAGCTMLHVSGGDDEVSPITWIRLLTHTTAQTKIAIVWESACQKQLQRTKSFVENRKPSEAAMYERVNPHDGHHGAWLLGRETIAVCLEQIPTMWTLCWTHFPRNKPEFCPVEALRRWVVHDMFRSNQTLGHVEMKRHWNSAMGEEPCKNLKARTSSLITCRRKFRSQTSDNMDRWKSRSEKRREEKEEKVSEERRSRCAKR